jgi:hypothetical protein
VAPVAEGGPNPDRFEEGAWHGVSSLGQALRQARLKRGVCSHNDLFPKFFPVWLSTTMAQPAAPLERILFARLPQRGFRVARQPI